MPIELKNTEFNLIWLKNKMPQEHVANLLQIIFIYPKVTFNIWIDCLNTKKLLVSQLKDSSARINFRNLADIKLPEEVARIASRSLDANILGGLSDIYKLFVLTRSGGERYRYYIEADNLIDKKFANKFDDFKFGAICVQNDSDLVKISAIQPDCLFVDIDSDLGNIYEKCQAEFTYLFKDPLLNGYFNKLLEYAEKNKGLSESDVMQTYPVLIVAVIMRLFMHDKNNNDIFGLNKYLLNMSDLGSSYRTMDRKFKRSWLTEYTDKLPPIASGFLSQLTMLRILELGDMSCDKEMSKFYLDFLTKCFLTKFKTSLDLVKHASFITAAIHGAEREGMNAILIMAENLYASSTSSLTSLTSAMDNLGISSASSASSDKPKSKASTPTWKKGFLL